MRDPLIQVVRQAVRYVAFEADGIPAEIRTREHKRFGLTKLFLKDDGKPDKSPWRNNLYEHAILEDEQTLAYFDGVRHTIESHPEEPLLPAYSVPSDGGRVIMDLDQCLVDAPEFDPDSGEDDPEDDPDALFVSVRFHDGTETRKRVADWAGRIIEGLASHTQISTLGTGLRVIVRGRLPRAITKASNLNGDGTGAVEFFSGSHFVTLTGQVMPGFEPIQDRQEELTAFFNELIPADRRKPESTEEVILDIEGISGRTDGEVLDLARTAAAYAVFGQRCQRKHIERFTRLEAGDDSDYGSDGSRGDWAYYSELFRYTLDPDQVERLAEASGRGIARGRKWQSKRGTKSCLRYDIDRRRRQLKPGDYWSGPEPTGPASQVLRNGKPKPPGANGKPTTEARPDPDRPAIEISTQRHEAIDAAVAALARDPDVYYRGDHLFTVGAEDTDSTLLRGGVRLEKAKGSARMIMLAESMVGYHLTRSAVFFHWKKDKSGEDVAVDCHPPAWLISAVAEKKSWPGLRPLMAVAECPYIRADGSIVQQPGYDPATGTYLRPSIDFPPMPDAPTREDAEAAAGRLFEIVREFPFPTDDDRAAWLAGLLTAIARPAIPGAVPGIAVIGNKAGCGKGLLIDVIGIITWGKEVPTTIYPEDKEEAAKVRVTFALAGKPIVHFDNIDEGRAYGSSALDSSMTSLTVDDRILGMSKSTGEIPLRICWFLSGNNLTPAKDAYRRWIPCNLVTPLERPEERADLEVGDLREHVRERRGELVRDALTILKAHADAGYPTDGWGPLGSFEAWDPIVRGAVWFATRRDCLATQRRAAEESPDRGDKLALLEGWRELPEGGDGGAGVTTDGAVKLVAETPSGYDLLRSALMRRSRDGKLPTARQVGNFIRGMRGANIGGFVFHKIGEARRSALWRVVKADTDYQASQGKCESTSLGESLYPPTRMSLSIDYDVNKCSESEKKKWAGGQTDSPRLVDSPAYPEEEF